MKTKFSPFHLSLNSANGSALLLVMIMCVISLLIMAAIWSRTSTVSKLNDRNNKYTVCCQAAEAAAEKAFARMAYDFVNYNLGQVSNNLSLYRTDIPDSADSPYWGGFVFSDAQGNTNSIYVNYLSNYAGALPSQYTNLSTISAPIYRIVANAWMTDEPGIIGTAQEDVLLSLVPITTYAIFYNGPLEFTWCASMTVRGRTHANDIVCVGTSATLQFNGRVSSTKTVWGPPRDGQTPNPWNQNTTFGAGYVTNIPTVVVAITMTNSHAIIDPRPVGEDVGSPLGQVRLYNQAHVILIVTNVVPAIGTNRPTPQVTIIYHRSPSVGQLPGNDNDLSSSTFQITNSVFTNTLAFYTNAGYGPVSWLSLTNTFTDKREFQTNLYVTQIDVGAYSTWLSTNTTIQGKFGTDPATILYVADRRDVNSTNSGSTNFYRLSVVRLVNGAQLPNHTGSNPRGFTVATPNPLYVKGDYNITADGTHYSYYPDSTTNSGSCVPASLQCDAITILSSAFSDANSAGAIGVSSQSNRVNAAIITGNVPSTGTDLYTFSGGVHNLMRMLENWDNHYLILNTSIVVLWSSQMGDNQFRNPTGWSCPFPYYSPPNRQWGFDPNFYDPAKQPPGVPSALVPIRFNWQQPAPNTH